jgi:holin-like protein
MLGGLAQLLLWQGLGELISKFFLPNIPGPVLGLLFLLLFLVVRGRVNEPLNQAGASFRQYLGLLFVPAAVGIVMFLPELKQHWLAYIVSLLLSLLLTIAATGVVLKLLSKD